MFKLFKRKLIRFSDNENSVDNYAPTGTFINEDDNK
jgi:hypothetical protein